MAFREASLETTAPPATVWRVWSDVNRFLKTFDAVLDGLKRKVETAA